MSNGSNRIIKVGFLFQQSDGWMGGIYYFKNLFLAMSKVQNPRLQPFINEPNHESSKILLDYAKIIKGKRIKNFRYWFKKIVYKFIGKKFNEEKYIKYEYDYKFLDVISHSEIMEDKPSIYWIPDFQHLHLPEMFSENELNVRTESFKRCAEKSTILVFSSEDALNDFKTFAPEYAYKGRVLHFVAILSEDVYDKTDEIKKVITEKFNLPDKYFYVPNQFWKHKNHKVVFEAISILKNQGTNIKVVFSGSSQDYRHRDYFASLMNFVKEQNIEENMIYLGLIDLIEVYYLMRNCISIINPSLFEGWSSTVEEAKSIGKKIVLSDINVHKEQNPPQGIYFDPHNANELAEILKEKWLNGKPGPDYDLEKQAQEGIEESILNFGLEYQKIVLEALGK